LKSVIKLEKDGLSLLKKMLKLSPKNRIDPWNAMASPYFDEIRDNPFCKLN